MGPNFGVPKLHISRTNHFLRQPLATLSHWGGGGGGGGGRGGLVVNTLDSGSRGRGFEHHSGRRVVSLSKTYLPPKVHVLVIPRKRWLHPNMTEKLFTGTLSIKPNQNSVPLKYINRTQGHRLMSIPVIRPIPVNKRTRIYLSS